MIEVHASATVHGAFIATAERCPERPFVHVVPETARVYGIASGELTYGEAHARVEALSARYRVAGIRAGHRVMLALENRPGCFIHWFALNALGAAVVPVNPDLRAAELEYMVSHAEPVLAVSTAARAPTLTAAGKAAARVLPVVGEDEPLPAIEGPSATGSDAEPLRREAAMLYTSGTTGRPKGCVLSNLYFLHAGDWYDYTGGLCGLRDGDRMITPLPLFHMNAMACSTMAMIAVGGCLTVLDRFHPGTWWDSVRECHATVIHYLGVMPSMLMNAPAESRDTEHDVRFGFGAGVVRELHAPFEARFGFPLVEAWAMTETGAGACIAANHGPRKVGRSVFGRPAAEVEVRIVDESGNEVPTGEPGELLVRHAGDDPRYGFFTEYHKDPDATAEAWLDGWFHTGDVVRQDADGDMVFVDRRKNVIRRSGENIAAVEVESVLLRHPAVAAVAVAAVPDEVRGDEVFACVQWGSPDTADETSARSLVDWCLDQLAYYKAPGYVASVDALPLTSTQKVQRGELKALAAELLTTGRCIDTRDMKRRRSA